MRINNNLSAMNTNRQLGINNSSASKSMEKLSSGFRINHAGDDAAGLAISEKMRAQIRGLNQASSNAQDGISLVQTADGALDQTTSILQRMRELAVQGSTGTLQDADRNQITQEFTALKGEIDDVAGKTQFNKMNLLDGTFGNHVTGGSALAVGGVISVEGTGKASTYTITDAAGNLTVTDTAGNSVVLAGKSMAAGAQTLKVEDFGLTIITNSSFSAAGLTGQTIVVGGTGSVDLQTGANQNETLQIAIGDMSTTGLALTATNVNNTTNAAAAITAVDTAITTVSTQRAKLGAIQNRLEYKINNLDSSAENLQSAESKIRDVDMAKEMVTYTKDDILQQAAQAMLAKANQAPQNILQLLR